MAERVRTPGRGWIQVPTASGVRAWVTSRHHPAGQSHDAMGAFNLGAHVGDDPQQVTAHRRELQAFADNFPIQWLNQVHGTTCAEISAVQATLLTADAACTHQAGLVLAVMTADCLPILLWSKHSDGIAVCHAGWRGLADGVLEATVEVLDTTPQDLCAWIGPAIGVGQYEVGEDVWGNFSAPAERQFLKPHAFQAKRWLDLAGLAEFRLQRLGVTEIAGANICTYDNQDFYSHRRHQHSGVKGECGRFASIIWRLP